MSACAYSWGMIMLQFSMWESIERRLTFCTSVYSQIKKIKERNLYNSKILFWIKMSINTRSFVKAYKNDRLNKIACKKSGTELALHTPLKKWLCFMWTASSLPGFFQLERLAILLMTNKSCTGLNLPEDNFWWDKKNKNYFFKNEISEKTGTSNH